MYLAVLAEFTQPSGTDLSWPPLVDMMVVL